MLLGCIIRPLAGGSFWAKRRTVSKRGAAGRRSATGTVAISLPQAVDGGAPGTRKDDCPLVQRSGGRVGGSGQGRGELFKTWYRTDHRLPGNLSFAASRTRQVWASALASDALGCHDHFAAPNTAPRQRIRLVDMGCNITYVDCDASNAPAILTQLGNPPSRQP